jgi:hypothetical protein
MKERVFIKKVKTEVKEEYDLSAGIYFLAFIILVPYCFLLIAITFFSGSELTSIGEKIEARAGIFLWYTCLFILLLKLTEYVLREKYRKKIRDFLKKLDDIFMVPTILLGKFFLRHITGVIKVFVTTAIVFVVLDFFAEYMFGVKGIKFHDLLIIYGFIYTVYKSYYRFKKPPKTP